MLTEILVASSKLEIYNEFNFSTGDYKFRCNKLKHIAKRVGIK